MSSLQVSDGKTKSAQRQAANKLNTHTRTAGKSSRLLIGRRSENSVPYKKTSMVLTFYLGHRSWEGSLNRPHESKINLRSGTWRVKSLYRSG